MKPLRGILSLAFLLVACAAPTPAVPTLPSPPTVIVPTFTVLRTPTTSSPIATSTSTVTPSPTETSRPTITSSPTQPPPTIDARATEAKIAALIFATLTAAAPTMTPIPLATIEPWRSLCGGVPSDQAAMVYTNYIGEKDLIVLVGKNKYIAKRGSDTLIPLPTGKIEVNILAEGWGKGWNWVERWEIQPGQCFHYWTYYTRQ